MLAVIEDGVSVSEVNELVNRFFEARKMMKSLGGSMRGRKGKKGRRGPGLPPGLPPGFPPVAH